MSYVAPAGLPRSPYPWERAASHAASSGCCASRVPSRHVQSDCGDHPLHLGHSVQYRSAERPESWCEPHMHLADVVQRSHVATLHAERLRAPWRRTIQNVPPLCHRGVGHVATRMDRRAVKRVAVCSARSILHALRRRPPWGTPEATPTWSSVDATRLVRRSHPPADMLPPVSCGIRRVSGLSACGQHPHSRQPDATAVGAIPHTAYADLIPSSPFCRRRDPSRSTRPHPPRTSGPWPGLLGSLPRHDQR